ncbi:hypothetical protein K440DRAFT_204542 [Wilcoxina mikolae CBS 423.85]|nr:hypothetical protein K440DRAFT_204542 [Wilcoxina mikolae CBS 423.85]
MRSRKSIFQAIIGSAWAEILVPTPPTSIYQWGMTRYEIIPQSSLRNLNSQWYSMQPRKARGNGLQVSYFAVELRLAHFHVPVIGPMYLWVASTVDWPGSRSSGICLPVCYTALQTWKIRSPLVSLFGFGRSPRN